METFQISRDGKHLKELASAIASLCNRKGIRDQVQSIYHSLKPIKGLGGRDLELWSGMLVLAQIIDMESPSLKLFERVTKIAIATTEKREEEFLFLDWDVRFLIAVDNFFSTHPYDGSTYVQADLITTHVIDEVKPPFRLRTEGLGKTLDRESILLERRIKWFKDAQRNPIHKTGWRIDTERLKRRVAKFKKYIQPPEDLPNNYGNLDSVLADIAEKYYPQI